MVDYLQNIAHRAMEVSERRGKLQTEDLLYLIRHVRPAAAFISLTPFLGVGHTVYLAVFQGTSKGGQRVSKLRL